MLVGLEWITPVKFEATWMVKDTMLNWLMFPKMFLVIIVTQFLLVNDGIVVVQLLSLVVIVSPNISNSTSQFCGTLTDDATSLLSA